MCVCVCCVCVCAVCVVCVSVSVCVCVCDYYTMKCNFPYSTTLQFNLVKHLGQLILVFL